MSNRVGIDLMSADGVREALSAHGERYLRRMFSPRELRDCCPSGVPDLERLAARVAAKEATFKVLRVGARPVAWTDVEVVRCADGAPELVLHAAAATMASTARIERLSVSLSHERGCAIAVVIAEIEPAADD